MHCAPSALHSLINCLTQGVALGYFMPRLQREEPTRYRGVVLTS